LPAASPLAISVGAVHQGGVLADYTSRGPTVDGRFKPDFAAPAGFVLPAGGDAIFGTSFSTPFLAGATAVLGDINFKNQAEIYKILKYMTFYQDKDMDNSRGWGVPNFDHTFTDVTCSGYEFTTGGPYRMYCNGYPVYVRKTAFVSLQLAPGTFVWNGAQHESTDLTLTDNTPLLLEYPKWHGLFLSDTGKGQQKVFDIVPQEADSEIHYHMDEAGIVKTGLYKKVGESGKQSLRLSISNN
jgi:subtilisin family serine protease